MGRSTYFKAHLPFNQLAREPGFLQIVDHAVPGGGFAGVEPFGFRAALNPHRFQCGVRVPVSKVLALHFPQVGRSAEFARARFRGARENTGAHQLFREGRKVSALVRLRRNIPNASALPGIGDFIHRARKGFILPIPAKWIGADLRFGIHARAALVSVACGGFHNRDRIEIVTLTLGKHENILVAFGHPVANAFRHRVRLRPNDVGTQQPPILTQGERDRPRDTHQVFRLEPWNRKPIRLLEINAVKGHAIGLLSSARAGLRALASACRVAIPQVDPHGAVPAENAPHVAKDFHEVLDVKFRGGLEAQRAEPGTALRAKALLGGCTDGLAQVLRIAADFAATVYRLRPITLPYFGGHLDFIKGMLANWIAAPRNARYAVVPESPVGRGGYNTMNTFRC